MDFIKKRLPDVATFDFTTNEVELLARSYVIEKVGVELVFDVYSQLINEQNQVYAFGLNIVNFDSLTEEQIAKILSIGLDSTTPVKNFDEIFDALYPNHLGFDIIEDEMESKGFNILLRMMYSDWQNLIKS